MPRGYRCIVFAAVGGLALIGATPQNDSGDQAIQPNTESVEAQGLDNIAAAIWKANKTPQPDSGCEPGQENRHSDLCAQWKAADAAAEATWWAAAMFWLGMGGAVIGALTLTAAAFAAWYAREAARHTETGALEAAKGAKAAQDTYQAYLATERAIVRVISAEFRNPSSDHVAHDMELALTVMNYGRSNAVVTNVGWTLGYGPLYPAKSQFEKWPVDFVPTGEKTEISPLGSSTPAHYPAFVLGYIEYQTLGSFSFRTHFCFKIEPADRDSIVIHTNSHWADRHVAGDMPADT